MKKILLAIGTLALVACAGKTGLEKELIGRYDVKPELPQEEALDKDAAQDTVMAEMFEQMKQSFAQMKLEMNFDADRTMTILMSGNPQSNQAKWEIQGDSLLISDGSGKMSFGVTKTDDGFKLTSDDINYVLTPKAE